MIVVAVAAAAKVLWDYVSVLFDSPLMSAMYQLFAILIMNSTLSHFRARDISQRDLLFYFYTFLALLLFFHTSLSSANSIPAFLLLSPCRSYMTAAVSNRLQAAPPFCSEIVSLPIDCQRLHYFHRPIIPLPY